MNNLLNTTDHNKSYILINRYHCKECDYTSDNVAIGGKVTCFKCNRVNDIWLEGESEPESHKLKQKENETVQ